MGVVVRNLHDMVRKCVRRGKISSRKNSEKEVRQKQHPDIHDVGKNGILHSISLLCAAARYSAFCLATVCIVTSGVWKTEDRVSF
jgi:hypothetical protein